ncbi:hypothetical protein R3P38DRAFT_2773735 [Favolaschia claudopus]|uniref:Uncharacterized protein n=1 Tax=Favolaschia claudopus TaxID=2862362 RepID=A0AAW0C338_9AGAR
MKRYFTRSSVSAAATSAKPDSLSSFSLKPSTSASGTLADTRSVSPPPSGTLADTRSVSPPPAAKKSRVINEDDPPTEEDLKRMEKNFGRDVKRLVKIARENKGTYLYGVWALLMFDLVVVPGFRFLAAIRGEPQPVPEDLHSWLDGAPRVACSEDGFALVVHIPGAIRQASADLLLTQLVDFVDEGFNGTLSLVAGADGKTRDQRASYHEHPGQIAGLFKLVRAWLPIGHPHSNPVPSRDLLKTGRGFAASLNLIAQLRLVSHRVNCIVEAVDPKHFQQLRELHAAACRRYRFYDILGTKDPLYMEGRELMYNRQTPLHADNSDPLTGWAVLVVVGPFTGGDLFIPCLNMRLLYNHGTIIMIREIWYGTDP